MQIQIQLERSDLLPEGMREAGTSFSLKLQEFMIPYSDENGAVYQEFDAEAFGWAIKDRINKLLEK